MSNKIQPNIVLFRYTGTNNAEIHAQLIVYKCYFETKQKINDNAWFVSL